MLLDVNSLFAKDVSIVDGTHQVVDLGGSGLGARSGMSFFVEVTTAIEGISAATWRLYTADDEAGTLNKEEILVTPEYVVEKLKKGFSYMVELPVTKQRYLILEIDKDGVATEGKYWSGLTSSEQYAAHNV